MANLGYGESVRTWDRVNDEGVEVTETETLSWTKHTYMCPACNRIARAAKEAIDSYRQYMDVAPGMTDAEIVATFAQCISCVDGEVTGEHVSDPPSSN